MDLRSTAVQRSARETIVAEGERRRRRRHSLEDEEDEQRNEHTGQRDGQCGDFGIPNDFDQLEKSLPIRKTNIRIFLRSSKSTD